MSVPTVVVPPGVGEGVPSSGKGSSVKSSVNVGGVGCVGVVDFDALLVDDFPDLEEEPGEQTSRTMHMSSMLSPMQQSVSSW